jgi:hypothetical protein
VLEQVSDCAVKEFGSSMNFESTGDSNKPSVKPGVLTLRPGYQLMDPFPESLNSTFPRDAIVLITNLPIPAQRLV